MLSNCFAYVNIQWNADWMRDTILNSSDGINGPKKKLWKLVIPLVTLKSTLQKLYFSRAEEISVSGIKTNGKKITGSVHLET